MAKSGVTIGKWGDSSGNLTVEGTIVAQGEVTFGSKISVPNGGQLYSAGRLHIAGEELLYLLNKSGVIIGKEWGGNGNLSVQGTLTQSSDARLKEDIQTVDGALDKVMALRGVNFRWKSDGKVATGLIAQEVEAIIPDAVQDGPDGMKSVSYTSMIPLLIEAIKDQQAQIDQLRAALAQANG